MDKLSLTSIATLISTVFIFGGCSQKTCEPQEPKVIIKKVYIKQEIPKLEKVDLKELNLSKQKPLLLHVKVK
jgi:PBP1b-binding outer membrane lipoprotein LpoB